MGKLEIQFGLPPDHREQKSREQAEFFARAKNNPDLIKGAQAFGSLKPEDVKFAYDPRFMSDRVRYGY